MYPLQEKPSIAEVGTLVIIMRGSPPVATGDYFLAVSKRLSHSILDNYIRKCCYPTLTPSPRVGYRVVGRPFPVMLATTPVRTTVWNWPIE